MSYAVDLMDEKNIIERNDLQKELAYKLRINDWNILIKFLARLVSYKPQSKPQIIPNKYQSKRKKNNWVMGDLYRPKIVKPKGIQKDIVIKTPKYISDYIERHIAHIFDKQYLPIHLYELICKHFRAMNIDELIYQRLISPEGGYPAYVFTTIDYQHKDLINYRTDQLNIDNIDIIDVYNTPMITRTPDNWNPIEVYNLIDSVHDQSYKVFVENIDPEITSLELMYAFQRCGQVEAVEIFRESMRTDIADLTDHIVSPEAVNASIRAKKEYKELKN